MAQSDPETDDDGIVASINIIPFVDIVLVLLVIFMLTSGTIVRASLGVELPRSASAGKHVESTVNLAFTREHQLLLNGQPSSYAAAATFIRGETQANKDVQAVIAADKGVEYGKVVELIDLVRENGVTAFALDAQRGGSPVASARAAGGAL